MTKVEEFFIANIPKIRGAARNFSAHGRFLRIRTFLGIRTLRKTFHLKHMNKKPCRQKF